MSFEILKIKAEIIKALKEEGIIKPTKIQTEAIPMIKAGKDVIGMSNTGSGKTVAFAVPILEKIVPGAGIQALILAPTRELVVQIQKEFIKFSKYLPCSVATVFGGVSLGPQINALKKADIVVGTTGRLIDHLNRGNLNLSNLSCLTLDEADKMVEMGFIEDVKRILRELPENKQILLFGATISQEVDDIKKNHMNNPVVAKAEIKVSEDLLEQYYYDIQPNEKFSLLVHLLKKDEFEKVMIFCATRANVDSLTRNLRAQKIKVDMIHGKLNQNNRLSIVDGFNNGKSKILVASAVAARGLDIRNVTHVINYGLSNDAQEYIHRVGRTARAGETGKAITLLEPKDHEVFYQVLRRYNVTVDKLELESFERLKFDSGRDRRDGRGERSGSGYQGNRYQGNRNRSPGQRSGGDRNGIPNGFVTGHNRSSSNSRMEKGESTRKPRDFSK